MPVFVDTNVLVYRYDSSEAEKQARCEQWLESLWEQRSGRLSYQVLQEFYVTVVGKLDVPMDTGEARQVVRTLEAWQPLRPDLRTFQIAWDLQDGWSLSWWDALIIAAARVVGCHVVLTEDLQTGAVIDGVRIVNPFETAPDELGRL